MAQIYDIDFSVPHDDFMKSFNNHLNNWGNQNMRSTSIEQSTKNGKYMYKIEVTNSDDNNKTTMLFEKNANNGDILFVPSGFSSFGGTFYKQEDVTDSMEREDDTMEATLLFLEQEAKRVKGKFIAKKNKSIYCIIEGNSKQAKECIVDSNGNVYGSKDVSTTSMVGEAFTMNFDTNIGDWNKQKKAEDPDFAKVLNDKAIPMLDKMDYIGKYVIGLKSQDEIESKEFKDIFCQAGLLSSGFQDKTLNTIYKLFV